MANRVNILNTTIHVGDIIRVHHKVKEKNKERVQIFSGVVIRIKGQGSNKSFTVRRIASAGIGVERIWPVDSPLIARVEVRKRGKVRRAKLYFLRKRVGKKATRVKIIQGKREKKKTEEKNEKEKPGKSGRKSSPQIPPK